MEATVEAPSAQTRKDYTSRPGALSRFFRMSRDGWKSKYKDLKATVKGYKNRIADLTKSREQWRIRAERAGEQITTLEVEIAELRARLAALGGRGQKTRLRAELHRGSDPSRVRASGPGGPRGLLPWGHPARNSLTP